MSNSSGMSFTSVLTLIFIVLKFTHVITWSWVWVLFPIWISILLGLLILLYYKTVEWFEDIR